MPSHLTAPTKEIRSEDGHVTVVRSQGGGGGLVELLPEGAFQRRQTSGALGAAGFRETDFLRKF